MEPCPPELVAFAGELADLAGEVQRRWFRRPVDIVVKADGSPVTPVDQEAEARMRERIAERFPSHGIIGEEAGRERAEAEWVWILDPLDGTKLFLSGIPWCSTLIGLAHRGRFVLGVIDQALMGERWLGADGHGTRWNGERVSTRACPTVADAVLCRPGLEDHTRGRDADIDRACAGAGRLLWGASAYHVGLIASGWVDGVVTAGPKLHDLAPLDPILRNAGGAVSDWRGRPLDLETGPLLVGAGDPRLLDALQERLASG